jgi:cation:H+ antiporter
MNIPLLWLAFSACTLAILYSGTKLSRYGDIIAEKTGLGRVWIGVVLLAFITSLPELMTGFSSVLIFDTPDIAAGDVFGSCVFNILILALLDVFDRASPISSRVQQRHVLSAGFGILLLSVVAVNICLSKIRPDAFKTFGWIGLYTPIIIMIYMLAMRLIFFHEKRSLAAFVREKAEELRYEKISKNKIYINFSMNAAVVVVAAFFLPEIGKQIAGITGLGQTFVGNILIAFSTSIPEIVVSVTALKIGAADMAIGNLFGSNLFNIGILAFDDIFFIKGPFFSFIQLNHVIPALSAVIMMTIAVIGLTYRTSRKHLFLSWDALAIIAVYIMNMLALYLLR